MYAVMYQKNSKIIQTMIDLGADLNLRDKNGMTSLILACALNPFLKIIETLLEAHASLYERDNNGTSALMMASAASNISIVEMLINAGAKVQEKDNYGRCPIIFACQSNKHPDVISMLVKYGASLSSRDPTQGNKTANQFLRNRKEFKNIVFLESK